MSISNLTTSVNSNIDLKVGSLAMPIGSANSATPIALGNVSHALIEFSGTAGTAAGATLPLGFTIPGDHTDASVFLQLESTDEALLGITSRNYDAGTDITAFGFNALNLNGVAAFSQNIKVCVLIIRVK